MAAMKTAELLSRLRELSYDRRVTCLEVGAEQDDNRIFHVVNVHEDLAGVHIIIELWDDES